MRAGREPAPAVNAAGPLAARENGDEVIVTAEVGGGGNNGPATFTFSLASGGEIIQRMAISG